MPRIAIDGNICSGKTTSLRLLEKEGYLVHYAHDQQPDIVQKYNADAKRYSLGYHLHQLHNYCRPVDANSLHIYEGSPYSIKNIYGELLYEKGSFDVDEYKIYETYTRDYGWMPDIVIYLFCNPLVCYERQNQPKFDIDYIKELHFKYESTFDDLNSPILIYKVNAQEDTETVLNNIKDIISRWGT